MKVTILGCGRWASFHIWYNAEFLKNEVLVWGVPDKFYEELSTKRKNQYVEIPKSVKFTNDLGAALSFADYVVISISAQSMPDLSAKIAGLGAKNKTFVLCMKGIINTSGQRLSEVLVATVDKSNAVAVWVGPGHTQDLVAGKPNMMIISSADHKTTADVAGKFRSKLIRLYHGDDLIGAEIGAAAKNVIGIAAGMLDGAGMQSLKGALMARGVCEVSRLILAMGGKQLTAFGISHLGDYEATLFSHNSHNRMYGEMFFRGERPEYLAEGVPTSIAIQVLAKKHKVDMPICTAIYEILHKGKSMQAVLDGFMERDNVKEFL